jgi:hypothetical protein
MQGRFGWRLPAYYRFQVLATFAVIVVVVATVAAASGSALPGSWFALFLAAVLIWNAYWFLLRLVYQLEVGGGALTWRAPLRSGQVPLTEVVEIRPSRLYGYAVVTRRRTIMVAFATVGFGEFAAELQRAHPSVAVRVGSLLNVRAPRRWREGSGFYRHG